MQTEPIEMTPAQVMQAGQGCLICDIRTDGERTYGAIPGALAMDAEALLAAPPALAAGQVLVICCARGVYSRDVAEELRRAGSGVRISVLCPGPVQTEFDQVADVCFSAPSLSSRRVAECAVNGMFRGKPVIVPGARMKAVRLAQRLVPDRLLARICWHVQRKKSGT